MAWLSGHNMGAQKQHPGLHKVYEKYLSSFLFECQIASRVEFKVTLVTFDFTFLMSNHFTFCRSFKVTFVTFTCIFTHAFLQITSCVDFKAMLVTFNFTFLRVSPQITCRKGFKVAVVTFEFICFMSIQITSRRTFKVTFSAGILQPIVLGLNVIIQIGCGSCNMFTVITFKFQFFMFCLFMVFEIPLG